LTVGAVGCTLARTDAGGTMAKKQKGPGPAAVLGGMIAGFDQQVFRTTPPPHELVHHARPDDPVPTKDGGLLHVGIPVVPVRDAAHEAGAADEGEEPQAEASSAPDARP
jgi:hypothetical protein